MTGFRIVVTLTLVACALSVANLVRTEGLIRRTAAIEVQIGTGTGSWRGVVLDELGDLRACLEAAHLCPGVWRQR